MTEKYEILPTLTKDYILIKITQEQIFERYFQIKIQTGELIKSPVRTDDDSPSFSFHYSSNGKLRGRDWAGYFWGDCFDAVAFVLGINANDKKSFAVILDRIARDFRLHKYEDSNSITTGITIDVREAVKIKEKTIIQFQPRDWNRIDADFWFAGNINKVTLEEGKVYPCQYIWCNNNLVYTCVPKDPAYAYYWGPNDIKIYFPFRKDFRFMSNTSIIQGLNILKPARIGVITKSYKDVLSLRTFGISAIAPTSETVPITKVQWNDVKDNCDHWVTLMDFDRQGILMAIKLRKLYGLNPLFFTQYKPLNKKLKDGKLGLYIGAKLGRNYDSYPTVKDFFDYVKAYGKEEATKLVLKVKESCEEEFNKIDDAINNELRWLRDK